MNTPYPNLLPLPREVKTLDSFSVPPASLELAVQGTDQASEKLLRQFAGAVLPVPIGHATRSYQVTLALKPASELAWIRWHPPQVLDQAYSLRAAKSGSLIEAIGTAGLRYGLQTLAQILQDSSESGILRHVKIFDSPRLIWRGIHLDLAREMEYRERHVFRIVEHLAALKFNTLHLYLENKFAYRSCPKVVPPRVMSTAQAARLVRHAAFYGITIVPQVPTLGHMEHFLHGPHSELRERKNNAFNLCPTHPKARPFLAAILADIFDAFHPQFIHVGYDESHSGLCRRCRRAGQPHDILADHLNWLNSVVRELGATTMIYGDKFISPEDFPLADAANGGTPEEARSSLNRVNRDIIITDWHYTAPSAGTVRYFVENGFRVHAVTASNMYWHDSIPWRRAQQWIVESIEQAVADGAEGAFHSNWEYYRGQFFDNFWPFQGLAAERQWSSVLHDYPTWSKRFSARFWGCADLFSDIASLLETTPTERRRHFLDADILEPLSVYHQAQARFDYPEIADHLDRQIALFRRTARRRSDTLRMLDMPAAVIRYTGMRARFLHNLECAMANGDAPRALSAIDAVQKTARYVGAILARGHRLCGGAVVDRHRLRRHLRQLDLLTRFIRQSSATRLRRFGLERLRDLLGQEE